MSNRRKKSKKTSIEKRFWYYICGFFGSLFILGGLIEEIAIIAWWLLNLLLRLFNLLLLHLSLWRSLLGKLLLLSILENLWLLIGWCFETDVIQSEIVHVLRSWWLVLGRLLNLLLLLQLLHRFLLLQLLRLNRLFYANTWISLFQLLRVHQLLLLIDWFMLSLLLLLLLRQRVEEIFSFIQSLDLLLWKWLYRIWGNWLLIQGFSCWFLIMLRRRSNW